jgi:hypothetical protein
LRGSGREPQWASSFCRGGKIGISNLIIQPDLYEQERVLVSTRKLLLIEEGQLWQTPFARYRLSFPTAAVCVSGQPEDVRDLRPALD